MISISYRTTFISVLTSLVVTLGLISTSVQGATERVGVAAAVNPATKGTPPGRADRVIIVGSDMLQNERIDTSDEGRTQLLFLDGTALTIGPNSSVVLDEFVYDPITKTGKLAFSATKGLFRFVGGKISKTTPVTFKTPTAIIGIRGGIGIITVREAGEPAGGDSGLPTPGGFSGSPRLAQGTPGAGVVTTAQLAFGQMTVQSGGVSRAISIPGFQVVATNAQLAPSQPTRTAGPGENLSGLEGTGGENIGGAVEAPTNEDVADTQLSELGSDRQPRTMASSLPVGKVVAKAAASDSSLGAQKKLLVIGNSAVVAQQNITLDETAGTDGGVRRTGFTGKFVYGGRFLSQTPFTGADFATGRTTRVAKRNNNGGGAVLTNGFLTVDSDDAIFNLPIKSGNFVFGDGQASTRFGPVSGSGFAAPNLSFFYLNLKESNFSGNPSSAFAGVAFTGVFPTSGIRVYDLFPGFPGKSSIPMLPELYGGNFGGGPDAKLYSAFSGNVLTFPNDARSVALYGLVAIDGVGTSQRSSQIVYIGGYFGDSASNNKIVLSGYSRGSVRLSASGTPIRVDGGGGTTSRDGDGNAFFGTGGPDYFVVSSDFTSGSISTPLDGAGFVQTLETTATPALTFFHETYSKPATLPAGVGVTRTSQTLNGYVSGLVTAKISGPSYPVYIAQNLSDTPNSFKIVTNAATNRLYALINTADALGSQSSLFIPLGNSSGAARARQAFIDDDIFGARESTSTTATVGGATATGHIALITSTFTKLSSSLTNGVSFCVCKHTKWGFISGEVTADASINRHRFHLVPWVAGRLSGATVTASMVGAASYSGHVAANIMSGTKQYVAFGNYNQSWNFGSRSGTATISNLDGATYSGSIAGVSGSSGSEFAGAISGAGRSGSVQGAFMRGAASTTGEVGLQFQVTGGTYYAAGVGAAARP